MLSLLPNFRLRPWKNCLLQAEYVLRWELRVWPAAIFISGIQTDVCASLVRIAANAEPLVYLFSIGLIVASGCILFNFKAKSALLILAVVFLLSFLLLHIPSNLAQNLISPGAWTNALKNLAFSGGALIIAGSFDDDESVKPSGLNRTLGKLIPLGRFFFGVMLIVFGIDHFLYAQFVATLVPAWIGGNMFWTYLAAIALIGSGLSLITKIKISLVSLLMGIMIFIWFLILPHSSSYCNARRRQRQ